MLRSFLYDLQIFGRKDYDVDVFQQIDASSQFYAVHLYDLSFFLVDDIDLGLSLFAFHNTRSLGKIAAKAYHVRIFIGAKRLSQTHDEKTFQEVGLSLRVFS